jgi:PadR family transcriptional regulator, regulatory protein AphA
VSDVQLTPVSYVVLGLVAEGATTPYDMKQTAARSVGYFWSFPHSQLYAEPARLAELGLLNEQRESSGRRRRVYTLTSAGRQALDEWLREPTSEQPQIRDTGLLKLFFGKDMTPDELVVLAHAQEEAHKARLAVYEEKAPGIADQPQHAATLQAGLLFEQLFVDFWRGVADGTTRP